MLRRSERPALRACTALRLIGSRGGPCATDSAAGRRRKAGPAAAAPGNSPPWLRVLRRDKANGVNARLPASYDMLLISFQFLVTVPYQEAIEIIEL